MNTPSEQNPTNGGAKTADQSRKSRINNGVPTFTKLEQRSDLKGADPEIVNYVTREHSTG